ncbi:MAG: hypothetical protein ACFFBY_01270 [Promethearchaeota archaeon]
MTKKGKFKLFSYLIEDNLIFYKSLNRTKKLYAFSIFKVSNFYQVIPKLNEFMKRGYFYYYAIQIDTSNQETFALFCFASNEKTKLIELFNLIYNKLIDSDKSIKFYKEKKLEELFIKPIIKNLDFNIRLYKKEKGILIKNNLNHRFLEVYEIIYNYDITPQIIIQLANLIKILNQKAYLILNFKNFNHDIILDPYLIRNIEGDILDPINLEKEINNIFEVNLVKKSDVALSNIYRILWRLNLTDNHTPYKSNTQEKTPLLNLKALNLQEFNFNFEKLLKSNQIEFQRLNQYLTFINQKIILITLEKLNFKFILKIFKRFFSKYLIYLLILDETEYKKLLKIDKISLLKNIKIWNYRNFVNININDFRDGKI